MMPIEGNIKNIGRINIMPRKVYWVGIPESIKDKDKIEFLSRDIWTINYPAEKMVELASEKDVILFLNLDQILLRSKKLPDLDTLRDAGNLIKMIQEIRPLHTIAHTTHINPQLSTIFRKNSITYIEKNLHEINSALTTVIKTVDFIYEKTNRVKREHLRIEILENSSIPVKCTVSKNNRELLFNGYVRDLSLGGLRITFSDGAFQSTISVKDIVELAFPLGSYQIKVQKAIIARVNPEENSIGVYFDIKNEKMIRDFHAGQYMETLYHWIKEVSRTG